MTHTVTAHELVYKTAQRMAEDLYERFMGNNAMYDEWKAMCPELTPEKLAQRFITLTTPKLLDTARATLAGMLQTNLNSHLKEQIFDALMKDALVRPSRQGTVQLKPH